MGYFGHTCKLPFMERPMGPCPACAYARDMDALGEGREEAKERLREEIAAATASDAPKCLVCGRSVNLVWHKAGPLFNHKAVTDWSEPSGVAAGMRRLLDGSTPTTPPKGDA